MDEFLRPEYICAGLCIGPIVVGLLGLVFASTRESKTPNRFRHIDKITVGDAVNLNRTKVGYYGNRIQFDGDAGKDQGKRGGGIVFRDFNKQ